MISTKSLVRGVNSAPREREQLPPIPQHDKKNHGFVNFARSVVTELKPKMYRAVLRFVVFRSFFYQGACCLSLRIQSI